MLKVRIPIHYIRLYYYYYIMFMYTVHRAVSANIDTLLYLIFSQHSFRAITLLLRRID